MSAPVPKTVLVVEDEPSILRLILTALERSGYRALAASSVDDALRVSREHPGPIHLALLDVVLAGADAFELFPQLVAQRPDILVLYISGTWPAEATEGLPFMLKPFAPGAVLSRVRSLIGPPRPLVHAA